MRALFSAGMVKSLALCVLGVVLVGGAADVCAQGQENAPDYMLLENRFGELCTMCEAILLCRSAGSDQFNVAALSAADQDLMLYHFQTKTFWGQIATIWDYLIRWIEPVTSEQRPVKVYTGGTQPLSASETLDTAYLSRDPGTIRVADVTIDRTTDTWTSANGEGRGQCRRIELRDGLAFIRAPGA